MTIEFPEFIPIYEEAFAAAKSARNPDPDQVASKAVLDFAIANSDLQAEFDEGHDAAKAAGLSEHEMYLAGTRSRQAGIARVGELVSQALVPIREQHAEKERLFEEAVERAIKEGATPSEALASVSAPEVGDMETGGEAEDESLVFDPVTGRLLISETIRHQNEEDEHFKKEMEKKVAEEENDERIKKEMEEENKYPSLSEAPRRHPGQPEHATWTQEMWKTDPEALKADRLKLQQTLGGMTKRLDLSAASAAPAPPPPVAASAPQISEEAMPVLPPPVAASAPQIAKESVVSKVGETSVTGYNPFDRVVATKPAAAVDFLALARGTGPARVTAPATTGGVDFLALARGSRSAPRIA